MADNKPPKPRPYFVGVSLTPEEDARLNELCNASRRPRATIVRLLIEFAASDPRGRPRWAVK